MKKTKFKKIILSGILLTAICITSVSTSKAAFQANKKTQYTKYDSAKNWILNIRQMENTGNAMGLNEVQNDDLTFSDESGSNGIDVHMMRSTEYGAIAILSASGYGNPSNAQAITTTTGNNTGVILNTEGKWEWTAGGLSGSIFSGTNSRYYDTYTGARASAKVGDALGNDITTNPGCARWHSASSYNWVGESDLHYFVRSNGGIFSFSRTPGNGDYYCRGVAVVGEGL